MAKIFKSSKLILIVILAAASFLRIWKINSVPVSLFSDELDVGYQAYSFLRTGKDYMGNSWPLYFQSYADMRAPLYIYSAVPTVALFGITPLGVRLPAIIYGVMGVWAIYLLSNQLVKKKFRIWNFEFGILPALVLAISPWHIQYSRAAFEVTMLVAFLLFGLFFFFKSLMKAKYIWVSVVFFGVTPWIYSTARLFVPFLIVFLFFVWRKEILDYSKKILVLTILILGVFFLPMVYTILTGSAGQRFSYISIFTDPTTEGGVATQRLLDSQYGGKERSVFEKINSRLIHNRANVWFGKVVDNYFETFSSQFLFLKGDLNLRHSPEGIGQFYKIEAITLIIGSLLFFVFFKDRRVKKLIGFWIVAGVLPSEITRNGGHHATRLILILPPLLFLISYGIVHLPELFPNKLKKYPLIVYLGLLTLSFGLYLHTYYSHNPWYSERNWHAGYKQVVQSIKKKEKSYEKIIITNALDQPYIFFASYYPVAPEKWQKGLKEEDVSGFGKIKHLDNYYFGQVGEEGIESLAEIMDSKTLYVAAQREIGKNLIMDPQYVPEGLNLVRTISYPSGEPAFYFFEKAAL